MKHIFTEFFFRLFYLLVLGGIVYAHLYLTMGLQLEYFSSCFINNNQASNFGFENYSWQWPSAPICDGQPLLSASSNGLTNIPPNTPTAFLVHQSKSWNSLSLACITYFYQITTVNVHYFVIAQFGSYLLTFVAFQTAAFLLPAGFINARLKMLVCLHLFVCVMYFNLDLSMMLANVLNELNVETLDSELLTNI